MLGLVQPGGGRVLKAFLRSSLGQKMVVAVSGILLWGFLAAHLAGNLLLLKSPEAYNAYSFALTSNKALFYTLEAGLLTVFVIHIVMSIRVTLQNRRARGAVAYDSKRSVRGIGDTWEGGKTFASASMIFTGLFVLAFLVKHLINFRFAHFFTGYAAVDPLNRPDMFKLVTEHYQSVGSTLWYLAAIVVLGIHISHGFQSAFRSLGLVHPRYTPLVKKVSWGAAGLFTLGFGALPIWALIAF